MSSAGDPTLQEAAELFAGATGRTSSAGEYLGVLRSFWRFCAQEHRTRCRQLDPDLLLRHQAELARLAPSTRHHRLLLLRQWLRHLERAGHCPEGLSQVVRIQPWRPAHPRPALSLDDSLRLLAAGARISELLACDLGSHEGGLLWLWGKTGSRAVPLPAAVRSELEGAIRARAGDGPGAPLFRSRQGRLSDRRARELLADCCQRAGLPPQSPHDLRHAACARWLRAGVPLVVVSRALGHARPSTTLDHYASVTAVDLDRGLSADPLAAALALADPDGDRPGPPSPGAGRGGQDG